MSKLALQANSWYNELSKIDALAVLATPRAVHLVRRCTLDILSQKLCPKCNTFFPATPEFFHRDKQGKDGLHSPCKACRLIYRLEHLEQQKIYDAKWHKDNAERCARITREYRQTERGIVSKRVRAHNRRAHKRNAEGTHTTEELYQQLQRQKGKCYYCRVKLGKGHDSWHGDHLVPLSKGGTNYIHNIVIACPTCNMSKGNQLPSEFHKGGRLL